MIETVEQLKELRSDLVELWSNMSKEELYEEIFKEALDAINMEERVQTFMSACTDLSYTTYTVDAIKQLIRDKYQRDISDFCKTTLEDIEAMDLGEVKEYLNSIIMK